MTARLAELPPDSPALDLRREVHARLAAGELVVLPTETVYGIAARADLPVALARLRALKQRSQEATFTVHLASAPELGLFRAPRRVLERLAERYWPGPLTLVLPGVLPGAEAVAMEGWTGVRVPAHASTRALLEEAGGPIVMTSANLAGRPPMVEAGPILAAFGEHVALVLDGGPSALGEGSTVLRLGRGRFDVLRKGIIGEDGLRTAAGRRILFVCTGNTCRSPLAEGLARRAIAERLGVAGEAEQRELARFGFRVRSAGVHAGVGAPIAQHSAAVLTERGINLARHRSSPVLSEEVVREDLVYCLTRDHLDALLLSLPPGRLPQATLLDPEGHDIPDPIGGPLEVYRETAEYIRAAIEARLGEWV